MSDKKLKIHIACPNQNWLSKYVVTSLLEMLAKYNGKYDLYFNFLTECPIDNARNIICRETLKMEADWLLMLDSDNPPERCPLELVELDKDIMIFPTPIWTSDYTEKIKLGKIPLYWNAMDYVPEKHAWTEHRPRKGLQEIDAGGTGCILIANRVLQQVKPWFIREYDQDGIVTHGSDYLFCKRAKDAGFRVFTHYDYVCSHQKEVNLTEIMMLLTFRDISNLTKENINTKEYWDNEWSKRSERIYPWFDKIAELTKGKSVLDFGCGRGDLMAYLTPSVKAIYGVDISQTAIDILKTRGLNGEVNTAIPLYGYWDTIVCTEVLEHLDNDREMLQSFFEYADEVIYTVPENCLPPGKEPEHRRIYTEQYIREITPYLQEIRVIDDYYLVIARKESNHG